MNFDMDARKRVEEVLREREADLARVQRIGEVGGLDIDVVGGMTSRRSPEYLRLHGLSLDASVETHAEWRDRVHPGDLKQAEQQLFQALEGDTLFYEGEYRIIRPSDGAVRWIAARADIERDSGGRALRLVGAHIDITEQKHAQAALHESEARFRALATVGSSSIYRMSPDWREMRQLEGVAFLADTEATTSDWVERYIPVGERPRVREAIDRAIGAKGVFELEHRVLRADGTIGWTFSRAIPLFDDAGEIVEWFGAATDVTARVRADQSFTRLFQASPAPFLVIKPDAPRFTIVEVNDAYLAATMRTRNEVVGRGIFEAYPDNPNDTMISGVSTLRASLERVLASREPDVLARFQYDISRPDGTFERRWWSPVNSPVLDEDGQVEAIIHNANDVTAALHAESVLRESEERFAQFAASSSDCLWIRDAATLDMEYVSPAIQTIYGIASDGILGDIERWVELILPEDRETAIAHIKQAQAGASVTHEFRVRRPSDGALRWIRDTDFPLNAGDGHVQRVGGIAQDVTGARTATERQDVLISELQHRTRNLIAVVKGIATETMRETGPTEAFRSAFSDRLSALSRVQGLLSRSEVEPITIGTLLQLELDALGVRAAGDRVTLAGPEVLLRPSTVQTLALALHELATNARKYGALSHDGGHLAVTWRKRSEGDESRLMIHWIETGLEQALARPAPGKIGGGYGRELIEHALPHSLGARTSYVLSASGVCCTIDLVVRPGTGRGGP